MSVNQKQQIINRLDKEIADLEKKKAKSDNNSATEEKKAIRVSISKNASLSTIKRKNREIEKHNALSSKYKSESADLQEKIAKKRSKRNDAFQNLQKEQNREMKKEQKTINRIQQAYEKKIAAMEAELIPKNLMVSQKQTKNSENIKYDVFISHAWEDKESFVDELVDEMKKEGIVVWYDTNKINWGDSMRQKIDDGLKKSKFGVVVLSPNYIAEGKYWTKAELDGLFQLDSINGKVLLPIWYNLNKIDVMNFSPLIADKKAMTTATMTPREIAKELAELLQMNSDEE